MLFNENNLETIRIRSELTTIPKGYPTVTPFRHFEVNILCVRSFIFYFYWWIIVSITKTITIFVRQRLALQTWVHCMPLSRRLSGTSLCAFQTSNASRRAYVRRKETSYIINFWYFWRPDYIAYTTKQH